MFSPYYAWRGRTDPLDHCAINVALYGNTKSRWAMTERGRLAVLRAENMLQIGPSKLVWQDGALEIHLDEIGAPIPRRVRGTIRVTPSGFPERAFMLDSNGRHVWQPIAPRARINVTLDKPDLHWSGDAYIDSNRGTEPLEAGFTDWTWSRAHLKTDSAVLYDAQRRDGSQASLALRFAPNGDVQQVEPPPRATMPSTAWRIARSTRNEQGITPRIRRTLEDTPFYARTHVAARIFGEEAECFHESLSLNRFASPIVRAMLPFRMPRQIFRRH